MKEYRANNLNEIYNNICYDLYLKGDVVSNTKELLDVRLTLENIDNCIITNTVKSPSLKYLLAENIWYASGHNTTKFIGHFAKKWLQITDDGATNNSAYGFIMQSKFGFNQIEKMIELLKKDPDTRRACIVINDANENVDTTKDEQCTMYLHFFLRNNKLELYTRMRSNDIIYGFPYDVPAFIALQKFVAYKLKCECGEYHHCSDSMHYYNKDESKLNDMLYSSYLCNKQTYIIDWVKLYVRANKLYDALIARIENNFPDDIIQLCKDEHILKEVK